MTPPPDTLPLFPLKTVLFPGGILPLRIFEPRYLDMVSACLRTDSGFGVVTIHEGNEAGGQPTSRVWFRERSCLLSCSFCCPRYPALSPYS